jgi:hypothetical protein
LIEKEFGQAGRMVTDSNFHELDDIEREGFIAVIHLHGHLKEKIKITERATFEADSTCAREFFREFSKSNYIIFIGHSFNDDDIRQLVLRFITHEDIKPLDDKAGISLQQVTPKRAKLVAVAPVSNDCEKEVATGIWKTRGFIFIPMSASNFIKNLEKEIYIAKEKGAFNRLPGEMGIGPDVIQKISIRLEDTFTNFNQGDGIRYLARTYLGEILWPRNTDLDEE